MQTKLNSAQEQGVRIAINWLLSSISYSLLFPGSDFWWNFLKGLYFIPLSFVVGYCVRRLFNKYQGA